MPDGNEFGSFVPGVSTEACVKGLRAYAGVINTRSELTSQDLHLFARFVSAN